MGKIRKAKEEPIGRMLAKVHQTVPVLLGRKRVHLKKETRAVESDSREVSLSGMHRGTYLSPQMRPSRLNALTLKVKLKHKNINYPPSFNTSEGKAADKDERSYALPDDNTPTEQESPSKKESENPKEVAQDPSLLNKVHE